MLLDPWSDASRVRFGPTQLKISECYYRARILNNLICEPSIDCRRMRSWSHSAIELAESQTNNLRHGCRL
ncbi:MAG TPA: hypothetical protein VHV77_13305, partial [Pirellulales bacterium]|nr:hypothetical protein [Pirellulales bacterium]